MMNNTFLGYAKHESEKERIINRMVAFLRKGNTGTFSIDIDDDFSYAEIEEMKAEAYRRM